jgi:hypothetical protein
MTRKEMKKLRGRVQVEGDARGMTPRTEGSNNKLYVWSFRVERYDKLGDRLPPIQVELRGSSFRGAIGEGDRVRVYGRGRGGVVHAHKVQNLTTGAVVKPSDNMPLLAKIFIYPVAILWSVLGLVFWAGLAVAIIVAIVMAVANSGM